MEELKGGFILGKKERGSNPERYSLFALIAASADRLLGFEGALCRGRFFKVEAIGWDGEGGWWGGDGIKLEEGD